ncbi:PREDICTED: RNA-binding protein 33-like [Nipponia nippon]|uniref:RNA-binding protein 33-like n=1 Tax=Nipponia nippon TaxID=128390 RepID=UPI00051166A9|nr:PREDICTED: RNA-binding protein 33-like [Nipponia nippon]
MPGLCNQPCVPASPFSPETSTGTSPGLRLRGTAGSPLLPPITPWQPPNPSPPQHELQHSSPDPPHLPPPTSL